jgi:scyllo-inositol 2-dehydrogenase (NADP+)
MRVAYVGLGWATRAFHLPGAKRLASVEIVGGTDPSDDQRARWTKDTNTPAFATLEELLEGAAPEAVVVATPPDSHADLCARSLAAGVHVFCEKPFVASTSEADEVIAAAAEAGRRVAVNHQYREFPIFAAVKDRIGSEDAGRLVFCQMWQLMNLAPWDEPVAWRAAMPNRTLFEGGVHLVDLLIHLYEEYPAGVYAQRSSGIDAGREADAIQVVTLDFPSGRVAQITIDRLCAGGTRYLEVRADCERASLRASHGGRALLKVGKKRAERTGVRLEFAAGGLAWMERGLRQTTLARDPRDVGPEATRRLFEKVVAAFEANREPPSSAAEARATLEVIEAAYRSGDTDTRVALSAAPAASSGSTRV